LPDDEMLSEMEMHMIQAKPWYLQTHQILSGFTRSTPFQKDK
jgi:hypothetical protein